MPDDPRVGCAKRPSVAVAREQKPRPHHVDGADEHRGPRGVEPPRAVVGEAPAQHPERHGVRGRMRGLTIERAAKRGKRSDAFNPCAHQLRRLVDDRAAVDDVDDAPRQRRVRAVLRRRADPEPFVLGDLTIDYDRRLVTVAGSPVRFTPLEYELLRVLSLNAGRVVTYETLLRQVWGTEAVPARSRCATSSRSSAASSATTPESPPTSKTSAASATGC